METFRSKLVNRISGGTKVRCISWFKFPGTTRWKLSWRTARQDLWSGICTKDAGNRLFHPIASDQARRCRSIIVALNIEPIGLAMSFPPN
jgi:hypothetical protein